MAGHLVDHTYSRDNEAWLCESGSPVVRGSATVASVMRGWQAFVLHNTRWVVESFFIPYSNALLSDEDKAS
jgi:hypothetical protein